MTNNINYDVMSMDIIEEAMYGMGYSLSQTLYSIISYCERRGEIITKEDLFTGDSERFYGIVSRTFEEESEKGEWKKR